MRGEVFRIPHREGHPKHVGHGPCKKKPGARTTTNQQDVLSWAVTTIGSEQQRLFCFILSRNELVQTVTKPCWFRWRGRRAPSPFLVNDGGAKLNAFGANVDVI